jgi:hypothetical protein
MKSRKFSQKLKLNKTTVSNLSNQEMNGIEGAGTYTCSFTYSCTCNTVAAPCTGTCASCVSVHTGCQDCTIPACPV